MKTFSISVIAISFILLITVKCINSGNSYSGEDILTSDELRLIDEVKAFIPEQLWEKVREYNISCGKIEGMPSVLDLELDNETMDLLSGSASWFVLDFEYRISVLITAKDEEDREVALSVDSITLHKMTDSDNLSLHIPRELFPYVIAE